MNIKKKTAIAFLAGMLVLSIVVILFTTTGFFQGTLFPQTSENKNLNLRLKGSLIEYNSSISVVQGAPVTMSYSAGNVLSGVSWEFQEEQKIISNFSNETIKGYPSNIFNMSNWYDNLIFPVNPEIRNFPEGLFSYDGCLYDVELQEVPSIAVEPGIFGGWAEPYVNFPDSGIYPFHYVLDDWIFNNTSPNVHNPLADPPFFDAKHPLYNISINVTDSKNSSFLYGFEEWKEYLTLTDPPAPVPVTNLTLVFQVLKHPELWNTLESDGITLWQKNLSNWKTIWYKTENCTNHTYSLLYDEYDIDGNFITRYFGYISDFDGLAYDPFFFVWKPIEILFLEYWFEVEPYAWEYVDFYEIEWFYNFSYIDLLINEQIPIPISGNSAIWQSTLNNLTFVQNNFTTYSKVPFTFDLQTKIDGFYHQHNIIWDDHVLNTTTFQGLNYSSKYRHAGSPIILNNLTLYDLDLGTGGNIKSVFVRYDGILAGIGFFNYSNKILSIDVSTVPQIQRTLDPTDPVEVQVWLNEPLYELANFTDFQQTQLNITHNNSVLFTTPPIEYLNIGNRQYFYANVPENFSSIVQNARLWRFPAFHNVEVDNVTLYWNMSANNNTNNHYMHFYVDSPTITSNTIYNPGEVAQYFNITCSYDYRDLNSTLALFFNHSKYSNFHVYRNGIEIVNNTIDLVSGTFALNESLGKANQSLVYLVNASEIIIPSVNYHEISLSNFQQVGNVTDNGAPVWFYANITYPDVLNHTDWNASLPFDFSDISSLILKTNDSIVLLPLYNQSGIYYQVERNSSWITDTLWISFTNPVIQRAIQGTNLTLTFQCANSVTFLNYSLSDYILLNGAWNWTIETSLNMTSLEYKYTNKFQESTIDLNIQNVTNGSAIKFVGETVPQYLDYHIILEDIVYTTPIIETNSSVSASALINYPIDFYNWRIYLPTEYTDARNHEILYESTLYTPENTTNGYITEWNFSEIHTSDYITFDLDSPNINLVESQMAGKLIWNVTITSSHEFDEYLCVFGRTGIQPLSYTFRLFNSSYANIDIENNFLVIANGDSLQFKFNGDPINQTFQLKYSIEATPIYQPIDRGWTYIVGGIVTGIVLGAIGVAAIGTFIYIRRRR